MTSQSIIQGIVLLLYLIAMVMVGFVFYKKNSTHSDYVLGGRGMNVWVTSLSARLRYERLAVDGDFRVLHICWVRVLQTQYGLQ